MKNIVYCITGHSESGDDYGPWLFKHRPTEDEIKFLLIKECPGEWEENEDGSYSGPGSYGSYVHLSDISEISLIDT